MTPGIAELGNNRDFTALLVAIDSDAPDEDRAAAVRTAIDLILEDVQETDRNIEWSNLLIALLIKTAVQGDEVAARTLQDILARKVGEVGWFHADNLRHQAADAIRMLGSQGIPQLRLLLLHEDPNVRIDAATNLGKIGFDTGDGSLVGSLVAAALNEDSYLTSKWAMKPPTHFFMREACFLAAKNIERSNPDGYTLALAQLRDIERAFLSVYPAR